ncbi:DUF2637 domain-containing protein [Nocardiopsis suaedae]|uniref:DUF2637 domain-containing protein n=1 Tax=Nocardiopsis suaedae TaxID=3018444 RepID=A0ABT4TQS1_9ACTN|nr:DUF2637 domain-containing protein [Nocardiopsis suaedae]MDA2807039.1 DUF2637 domain-containing protein [Nocardiopsis suaedae]
MAVKSSSSPASPARRRPGARPATGGPQGPRGPRTAAVLLTAAGVLLIAACAVVLSYSGIYQLALQGNVPADRAHLYPGVFTLLLLLAFWASFLLRAAPRPQRLQVDGLILLLITAAAGASALSASEQRPSDALAVVLAAVAPWLALLVAFVLFIRVWRYLNGELPDRRARRRPHPAAADEREGPRDGDGEEPPAGALSASASADGPEDAGAAGAAGEEPEEEKPPAPTLLWPRAGSRRTASAESAPLASNDEDTDPVSPVRVLRTSDLPDRADDGGDGEGGEEEEPGAEDAPGPEDADPAEEPAALREVPAPDAEDDAVGDDALEDGKDKDGEGGDEAAPSSAPSAITSPTVPLRPLSDDRDADGAEAAGEDRPELPRRDPESGNPIKRAAEEAPSIDGPTAPAPLPGGGRSAETSGDDDGFMDSLPADDPTSDEADGGEAFPPPDADTRVYGTPPGAEPMPKRPMVLKPRRAPMAEFPAPAEEPPASRVRSGPTPPDAPEDS